MSGTVHDPNAHDLDARAAAIFGGSRGVAWPYGIADPSRANHPEGPDGATRFEQALRGRRQAQRTVVAWAEKHGLRHEYKGCCPHWLLRRRIEGCRNGGCDRWRWMDHVSGWTTDGLPVALTAAPYGLDDREQAEPAAWIVEYPRLSVAYGTGWYGFDTTRVLLWRRDRIHTLAPA